jgi:hypothetical protein
MAEQFFLDLQGDCRSLANRVQLLAKILDYDDTLHLTPYGRTLLVDLLHRAPTLRTGDNYKRPSHDILDLGLMLADMAAIAVPEALAAPHPGQLLGRELLGVHTVLA